jgi:formate dehydrogenase subunit gamma
MASVRHTEIHRFGWTERAAHWWLAATTGLMMLTGAFLYFPPLALYLDRPTAKMLHLWAAIALPAGWLVLTILGDRRALGRTLREADRFDRDDVRWLKGGPRRLFNRDHEPPQGRLNAGQKMNLAVTTGLLVVLGVSGTLLWLGERDTTYRFAGSVHVHDLATLAITFLISGHLYLALIHPVTSNALSGMTTGSVDREWARRHHTKWVEAEEAAALEAAEEAASGAAEEAAESALPAALGEQLSER